MKEKNSDGADTSVVLGREEINDEQQFEDLRQRRIRAYQWYVRCAYPRYEKMMQQAQAGKWMDVEVSDFDLLPWKENGQLDQRKYREMQTQKYMPSSSSAAAPRSASSVDKSSVDIQADNKEQETKNDHHHQHADEPSALNKNKKTTEEQFHSTTSTDKQEKEQLVVRRSSEGLLQANKTLVSTSIPIEGRRHSEGVLQQSKSTTLVRRSSSNLFIEQQEEEIRRRRQNAYNVYKSLANATRKTLLETLKETHGLPISKEDVDLLLWNIEQTKIVEHHDNGIDWKEDLVDTSTYQYPMEDDEWDDDMESRSERAYNIYIKLAKPTRHSLRCIVDHTSGTNIQKDDIDLLPWNMDRTEVIDYDHHKAARKHVDSDPRQQRQKVYSVYKKLANPTAETLYRVLKETKGLKCSNKEIDSLPWDSNRYKVVEEELTEYGIKLEPDLVDTSNPNYRLDNEWDDDMEARCQQAFGVYLKLAQPTRHTLRCIIDCTTGLGIQKDDVDLLKWNSAATEVVDFEEEKRKRDDIRRQREYEDLRNRRQAVYTIYKKLANPTAETMHRALKETRGLEYSEEDIDLLIWDQQGSSVVEDKLERLGIVLEADLVETSIPKYPADDKWDDDMEARSQQAFNVYVNLDQPTRHTLRCIVKHTTGLGIQNDDIGLLPWNLEGTGVIDYEAKRKLRQEERMRKEKQGQCCTVQ